MLFIIFTIYIIFTALLFSLIINKELEETIPIIFIIDGIIISILTYLKNVYLGIYISVFLLPFLLLLYNAFLLYKKKIKIKDIIKKFSIRSISIVIVFAYAYILSKNTYVTHPDEITLWSIRVFDMLKNNSLTTQCSMINPVGYTRYPLFISSIQCLVCYLGGGYREALLYFTIMSFCFSLLLNIVPKLKIESTNDLYKLTVFLGLIFLSGICYRLPIYRNILIDGPMAIFAALTCYVAYSCNLKKLNEIIILIIYIIGLLMTKQICLVFVCIIILFIILDKIKINNWKIFLTIISCLFVLGLIILFSLNMVTGLNTFKIIIDSYKTNGLQGMGIARSFLYYVFKSCDHSGIIKLPYFYYLLIACAVFLITNAFNKNPILRKRNIKLTIVLFLGGIVWLFAHLYFSYHVIGRELPAQNIIAPPNYARYMDTYIYMLVITLFTISINNLPYYPNALSFLIPMSIILCCDSNNIDLLFPHDNITGAISSNYLNKRIEILDTIPNDSNLLIVDQYLNTLHGYGYDQYTNYYYYINNIGGNKTSTAKHFGEYSDCNDEYKTLSILDIPLEDYISYVSNFDYIFLSFVNDEYIKNYWEPSTDTDLYNNGLYKIISVNDNKIKLQFVDFYN